MCRGQCGLHNSIYAYPSAILLPLPQRLSNIRQPLLNWHKAALPLPQYLCTPQLSPSPLRIFCCVVGSGRGKRPGKLRVEQEPVSRSGKPPRSGSGTVKFCSLFRQFVILSGYHLPLLHSSAHHTPPPLESSSSEDALGSLWCPKDLAARPRKPRSGARDSRSTLQGARLPLHGFRRRRPCQRGAFAVGAHWRQRSSQGVRRRLLWPAASGAEPAGVPGGRGPRPAEGPPVQLHAYCLHEDPRRHGRRGGDQKGGWQLGTPSVGLGVGAGGARQVNVSHNRSLPWEMQALLRNSRAAPLLLFATCRPTPASLPRACARRTSTWWLATLWPP